MPDQPTFADLEEVLTIKEAAAKVRLSDQTIRKAITSGELEAFTVGGRDPIRSGRGLGYRILARNLQTWYFGQSAAPGPKS